MGCDIHLFAEVKKRKSFWKPKEWANVDKWSKNRYYEEGESDRKYEVLLEDIFYSGGRNYNLFAALCGVRSRSFKDKVIPISQPKGTPKDVSKTVKEEIDSWSSDAHSNNWNTLVELLNYDWSPWGGTCDLFLNEVIPKMKALSRKYSDVRIVYFFDN